MIPPEPELLKHREMTKAIIGGFYSVYKELGHGFLESVYEESLEIALQDAGLTVARQVPVPVFFRGHAVGNYKVDILVNGVVMVELKVARSLDPTHYAQLMHYLRATPVEVGLLLNFGPRAEFKRLVFENSRKAIRVHPRESAVGLQQ